jgi:hypothetical protein
MYESLSSIIPGNIEVWDRKHTGDADAQVKATIESQIENAINVYESLVKSKEKMKQIQVDTHTRAELIGRFYLLNEVITAEQISTIKSEIKKPTHVVEPENSLWDLYTKVIYALQKSHPKNWMEQQRMVQYLVCTEFQITDDQPTDLEEDDQNDSSTEEIPVVDPIPTPANQETEEVLAEVPPAEITQPVAEVETKVEETPVVIPETQPIDVVNTDIVDDSWNCLSCGKLQGPNDIFHDGQLCSTCAEKD